MTKDLLSQLKPYFIHSTVSAMTLLFPHTAYRVFENVYSEFGYDGINRATFYVPFVV